MNRIAHYSTEIGVGLILTTITMAVLAQTVMGLALQQIEYIAVGGGFGSLGLAKWLEGKRPKLIPAPPHPVVTRILGTYVTNTPAPAPSPPVASAEAPTLQSLRDVAPTPPKPAPPLVATVALPLSPAAAPLPPKLPSSDWSEEDASQLAGMWGAFYARGEIDLTRWVNDAQLLAILPEDYYGASIRENEAADFVNRVSGANSVLFTAGHRKWILDAIAVDKVTITDPVHRTTHTGSRRAFEALQPRDFLMITRPV